MKTETKQQQFTARPNLNELAKEVYQANKAKGFHDEEHSNEHYLCLVISELMEAVEADRKGKRAKIELFIRTESNNCDNSEKMEFFFRQYVKDTVEDELADAIIRLLDLAGLRGWELSGGGADATNLRANTFTENMFSIIDNITGYRVLDVNVYVRNAIIDIEYLASEVMQIDIWRHVDLKLKYNATRERLHGKKY